jgi:hypothetical protein
MGYAEHSNENKPATPSINFMQVVPNSHYWTDLNQIITSFDYSHSEMNDKEYIIIGLTNSKNHKYKLKPLFKEDIKVYNGNTPIFESLDQMIEYVRGESYNEKTFYVMLVATVSLNINLTNGMKMERTEIYKRLDGERNYQDAKWGVRREADGTPDEEKPVAEWINYMEFHLLKAKNAVYYLNTEGALDELRKVTALGVRAMEIHGCPERKNGEILNPLNLDPTTYKLKEDKCCGGDCDCQK